MLATNERGSVVILAMVGVIVVTALVGVYVLMNGGTIPLLNKPRENTASDVAVSPKPQPSFPLEVISPNDQTLIDGEELLVEGKTAPNATVTLMTDDDENIITSDEAGNFSGVIRLVDGINTLTVTAFNDAGDEKTVTLEVVSDKEST